MAEEYKPSIIWKTFEKKIEFKSLRAVFSSPAAVNRNAEYLLSACRFVATFSFLCRDRRRWQNINRLNMCFRPLSWSALSRVVVPYSDSRLGLTSRPSASSKFFATFSGKIKIYNQESRFLPERAGRFSFSRRFLGLICAKSSPRDRRRHGLHLAPRQGTAQERVENEPNPVPSERGEWSVRGKIDTGWVRIRFLIFIFSVYLSN